MSEEPKTPRGSFAFSIRTLLVVIAIVGGWLGWNLHTVKERDEMAAWVAAMGGSVTNGPPTRPWKTLPWSWSILGAEPVSHIVFGGSDKYTLEDLEHAKTLFPEAQIWHRDDLK